MFVGFSIITPTFGSSPIPRLLYARTGFGEVLW